jgi:hypothetical protein
VIYLKLVEDDISMLEIFLCPAQLALPSGNWQLLQLKRLPVLPDHVPEGINTLWAVIRGYCITSRETFTLSTKTTNKGTIVLQYLCKTQNLI